MTLNQKAKNQFQILLLIFATSLFCLIQTFNLSVQAQSSGTTLYVDSIKSDSNDGLSPETAVKTIDEATSRANPGDTILVRSGTYEEPFGVDFPNNGTANNYITLKNYPNESPLITSNAWCTICITDRSYINIVGLRITNRASIGDYKDGDGNGILINDFSHHINITGNTIFGSGGGGISTVQADYLNIINNTVFSNARTTTYASSGISIYQPFNFDNNQSDYRIRIIGNLSYDNENTRPFRFGAGDITDGNGIILDDYKNTQNFIPTSTGVPYSGRTLVANNITAFNGGRGIHAFLASNVDIYNNTLYQNSFTPDIDTGDLSVQDSDNVRLFNNLISSRADRPCGTIQTSNSVDFDYNLCWSQQLSPFNSTSSIQANPLLQDPSSTQISRTNFRPTSTSPARNSGLNHTLVNNDIIENPRIAENIMDIGAFEFQADPEIISNTSTTSQANLNLIQNLNYTIRTGKLNKNTWFGLIGLMLGMVYLVRLSLKTK